MRVVLDANIYVSALISAKGHPARIIEWWLAGKFEVVVSRPILEEILRVTGYECIQNKYPQVRESRLEFVELLRQQAVMIQPSHVIAAISADESDNRIVECAVAGGAVTIVTGDVHLLELGEFSGIAIVTPAAFVALNS